MSKNITSKTSKTFNLKELFERNYFVIPDYQRGFSWEEEQISDLAKDIENIAKLDNFHYAGTIVATVNPQDNNSFEIVDGQQRLTSLVILLNEIFKSNPEQFIEVKEIFLERGEKGNERFVFTPNVETRDCFHQTVMRGKQVQPKIKSEEAIINAQVFFSNWLKSQDVEVIYKTIVTKLNFLFFTPRLNKEIGIMFEVINNRGKPLSELEKIKNYFIYYSTLHDKIRLKEDINLRWADIQINLSHAKRTSNDDENSFLRYCYLVFFMPNKEKSWDVYHECKLEFDAKRVDIEHINNCVEKMREFVDFLANASLHYAWFFNPNFFRTSYKAELEVDLYNTINYLRCQPVFASIMPLYLAIMTRLDNPNKVYELLSLLETVNMRLYVLPDIFRRADSKQGELFSFAHKFFHYKNWTTDDEKEPVFTNYGGIEIKGDIFDWLFHNLTQITYAYCPAEKFIDNLKLSDDEDFDFYRWQGIRYFLACYEEKIRSKKAKRSFEIARILSGRKSVGDNLNDQLSLEHIWASKNRVEEFSEKFHTKRRLGNFVLCGISSNIGLSKLDIPEKISLLIESNSAGDGALDMMQVAELNRQLDETYEIMPEYKRQTKNYWRDLAITFCEKREELLIEFALKRWKL